MLRTFDVVHIPMCVSVYVHIQMIYIYMIIYIYAHDMEVYVLIDRWIDRWMEGWGGERKKGRNECRHARFRYTWGL